MNKQQILDWIKGLTTEDTQKYLAQSIGNLVANTDDIGSEGELIDHLTTDGQKDLDSLANYDESNEDNQD
jgi:hypothetical protein